MLRRRSVLFLLLTALVGGLRPTFVSRPKSSISAWQSPLFVRVPNVQHPGSVIRLQSSADDKQQVEEDTSVEEESLGTKIDGIRQKLRFKLEALETTLNEFGQGSKPKALEYRERAQEPNQKALKKFKFVLLSWLCYSVFIAYRAFRGFFVILPAVFRETYRKMENAVDYAPLLDEPSNVGEDVNPKTGKVRLRTKATVAVLTAIVMFTYVMGGLMRVIGSFSKKLINKTCAYSAFEAAADEMLSNEKKMMKISSKSPNINGDSDSTSALAP